MGVQTRRLLDRGWSGVFREHLLNQLPISDIAFYFDSDRAADEISAYRNRHLDPAAVARFDRSTDRLGRGV